MRIVVVLAHPNEESFNHAIAREVRKRLEAEGHSVALRDLYAEKFEADLPTPELGRLKELPAEIKPYCDEIVSADGVVVVHPNWWGMPPAILKGYLDRVFRPGVAYTFQANDKGEGVPVGLLKARAALVINTSNTEQERDRTLFGDPLENLWRTCVWGFCGVRRVRRRVFAPVITSTSQQREAWLKEAADTAADVFNE